MNSFAEAKQAFDKGPGKANVLSQAFVPVDGNPKNDIAIHGADGKPIEEYYKWQFIYALIHSGLYAKDYIGVEIRFPKGSKGAQVLRLDGAIFDDVEWLQRYTDYWQHRRLTCNGLTTTFSALWNSSEMTRK